MINPNTESSEMDKFASIV